MNFGQGVYPPLLPEMVGALGLSLAAAGFLGTAFSLPRALLALPAGRLVERYLHDERAVAARAVSPREPLTEPAVCATLRPQGLPALEAPG